MVEYFKGFFSGWSHALHCTGNTKEWSGTPLEESLPSHEDDDAYESTWPTDQPGLRINLAYGKNCVMIGGMVGTLVWQGVMNRDDHMLPHVITCLTSQHRLVAHSEKGTIHTDWADNNNTIIIHGLIIRYKLCCQKMVTIHLTCVAMHLAFMRKPNPVHHDGWSDSLVDIVLGLRPGMPDAISSAAGRVGPGWARLG